MESSVSINPLEDLISRRRIDRVSAASQLARLEELAGRTVTLRSDQRSVELTGTSGAILPLITFGDGLDDEAKRDIASGIALDLEAMTQVVDWQQKEDVKRQMRRTIKECLRQSGADLASIEASTAKIMDVARARLAK
jgi:type I restriction enzyme R subunit